MGSVVVATVTLGMLYFGVDWRDAWASKQITADAARGIRRRDPSGRIWFLGHWGFQFYAEANGMRPLIADVPSSFVHKGDWLVMPNSWIIEQQAVAVDPAVFKKVDELTMTDSIPLRTVRPFYGTGTGVPVVHADTVNEWPRLSVTIYCALCNWAASVRKPVTNAASTDPIEPEP